MPATTHHDTTPVDRTRDRWLARLGMQDPQSLSAQSGLCDLLSRLLLSKPDPELVQLLHTDVVVEALDALEPGTAAWLQSLDVGAPAFEALVEDYRTLFLLPEGVSLRAGLWLERTESSSNRSPADGIREALGRLAVIQADASPLGRLPSDHLALLLAAAAHGLRRTGSPDQRAADALLCKFFDPYAASLGRTVRERAATPLYRAAGALVVELAEQRGQGVG